MKIFLFLHSENHHNMKLTPTKIFKYKNPLFFSLAIMALAVLGSKPAYSQIDYSYGVSQKGLRLGVGAGVSQLHSNWSQSAMSPAGVFYIDYDLSLYFTIGLNTSFGQLSGTDAENKLYFTQDKVNFVGGSLTFKVALGQFSDFKPRNGFQDAMKRLYIGIGVGEVYSNATLTPHSDGKGLPALDVTDLADGEILGEPWPRSSYTKKGNNYTASGTLMQIPISFGTNIALRGFLGNDKVELNPNFQYVLVQSPLFDGYQPNATPQKNTNIGVSGNQGYFVGSLALRFKF